MELLSYSIKCPECRTGIQLISEEKRCLIACPGCKSILVISEDSITSRKNSFISVIRKYPRYFKQCGIIVLTRRAPKRFEFITDDRVEKLKKNLEAIDSIDDFIDKL